MTRKVRNFKQNNADFFPHGYSVAKTCFHAKISYFNSYNLSWTANRHEFCPFDERNWNENCCNVFLNSASVKWSSSGFYQRHVIRRLFVYTWTCFPLRLFVNSPFALFTNRGTTNRTSQSMWAGLRKMQHKHWFISMKENKMRPKRIQRHTGSNLQGKLFFIYNLYDHHVSLLGAVELNERRRFMFITSYYNCWWLSSLFFVFSTISPTNGTLIKK